MQPGAVAAPGRTRDPLHRALADGARPRRQLSGPREAREGRPQVSARVSIQRGLNVPVQGSAAEAMLVAVAKVSAALLEAEIDAMPCVTVHDELVVEAAEEVADQAAAILERGMREGFERVFGHLPSCEDVARFVVGSVERGPTWGGKRFDPQALSELDKEILFKGLDEDHEEDDEADDDAILEESRRIAAKA